MNKAEQAVYEIQKQMYGEKDFFEKSAKNPFYGSKYVPLNSILWKLNPKLHERGCMMYHTIIPTVHPSLVQVLCVVIHEGGDRFEVSTVMPLEKLNPQEGCKANTYGRRYSTTPMFGIPDQDDDGEGAMKRVDKGAADKKEEKKYVSPFQAYVDATGLSETVVKDRLRKAGIKTLDQMKKGKFDDLITIIKETK